MTSPILTKRASIAIVNAYVVPVAAPPVEGGTALVEDGVITAVGANVVVPDGVRVLDAGGRWVLPGFIEAHGHLGVHEEGEGWAGEDVNEMTDPNGAGLRAIDGINIEEEGFRDALADGDLVVWSGDPLDVASRAEHVFVTGDEVYRWDAAADGGRGAGRVVEREERFGR